MNEQLTLMKKYIPLTGRILFSLIFLLTIMSHFKKEAIDFAGSKGVPVPGFLVPLSGIIAFLGGLSIVLGYKTKVGALLIILFLIPVTFFMHDFWNESNPQQMQMQMANFMKNIALLGGALLILYFGPGPVSIDRKLTVLKN